MRYYLVDVLGCVEPEIIGPFDSYQKRDETAKGVRFHQTEEDALFWLDIDHKGIPRIGAYSAGFFEK